MDRNNITAKIAEVLQTHRKSNMEDPVPQCVTSFLNTYYKKHPYSRQDKRNAELSQKGNK